MSRPDESREPGEPVVVPPVKARSGRMTGHVRVILGVSLFLTVIGMGIVLLVWTLGA
jgi:hypothetical protein